MINLIDLSLYNDINNWNQVASNVSGVLLKTSQNDYIDPTFRDKYSHARTVNLPIGLWHFYHPTVNSTIQINTFMNVYNSLPIKHRPMLDCEAIDYWYDNNGVPTHIQIYPPSKAIYTQWLRTYLQTIEARTGIIPAIYTAKYFWETWVERSDEWKHYPLWIANYYVSHPSLPVDWTNYILWQTGQTTIPGISKPVDNDLFGGTQEELRLFLDGTNIPTPPPQTVNYLNGKLLGSVNIRANHYTFSPIVRTDPVGTIEKIVDIWCPSEMWGKMPDGNWIALKYNEVELVKIQ
jgi:lysozyme